MGIGSPRHRIRMAWHTAVVAAALVGAPNAFGDALVPAAGVTAPPPPAPASTAAVPAVPAATAVVETVAAPAAAAPAAPATPKAAAMPVAARPVRAANPVAAVAAPVPQVALAQSVRQVALPLATSHAESAPPAVSRRGPQVRRETGTTSRRRFNHRRAAPSRSSHHRAALSAGRLPQAVHGVATAATPARAGQRGVAPSLALPSRPLSAPVRPLPVPPPPSSSTSFGLMSAGGIGFQLLLLFTCLTAALLVALPRRGPRLRQRRAALPMGCYGRLLERPG
jgi:hypothetical protein